MHPSTFEPSYRSLPYQERMRAIKEATRTAFRNMEQHEARTSFDTDSLSLVPVADSFENKQNVYNTLQKK